MLDNINISHCQKSKDSCEVPLVGAMTELANLVKRNRGKNCQSQSDRADFWQMWLQHENYLDRRCLSWMKGDRDRAEEALGRARIKAWEKWPEFAGKVIAPQAWLTQLTHNLCMDMHREHAKSAIGVDRLEQFITAEKSGIFVSIASSVATPESIILKQELEERIWSNVNALPSKLRESFILRCDREMSYLEIAEKLAISSTAARKRVEKARSILQKDLESYLRAASKKDAEIDYSCVQKNKKVMSYPKAPVAKFRAMNSAGTSELINYKITAICLERLPLTWYSSPSLMG